MKPIRVLHLITGLGLGGAERWLATLLARLPRERFDCRVVTLLSLEGPAGALAEPIRALGVPVDSLGLSRGRPGPGALLALTRLLRDWRPQAVQGWLYHADLLALAAARLSGCGAAVSWGLRAGYMDFSRYPLATRLTVRACAALSPLPEAITANSQAGAQRHRELGYRPRRLVVIENGVDGGRFCPDAEARAELRREWGVGGAPLVGLLARLDPMKGHDVFCRALELVRERFPEARGVFCGPGTMPGASTDEHLDALLAAHGLREASVRLGPRADAHRVLAALDVLALPSLGEGFPNAVAEALACGVPVAALDVGDARRLVEGSAGGLMAEGSEANPGQSPGEAREARAQALAGALVRLLSLGPEERAEMGARGRAGVLAQFSVERAAARWAEHFEELAKGRP